VDRKETSWIAFAGTRRLAAGAPREVATAVKAYVDQETEESVLVFDRLSSEPVELDLRGSVDDVVARLPLPAAELVRDEPAVSPVRSAGRPKLGVIAREVTLLPRHWEWLATQSGGASVALRKLVEQALRANADVDRIGKAREATYRFMTAIAGNEPNHEEAVRALFAGDLALFKTLLEAWPADIREHALFLAPVSEAAA